MTVSFTKKNLFDAYVNDLQKQKILFLRNQTANAFYMPNK
jgi:hypothetical protein